jgi:hypothetical protein
MRVGVVGRIFRIGDGARSLGSMVSFVLTSTWGTGTGIAAAAIGAGRWRTVFCFRFSPSYVVRIFHSYSEMPTHLFIHAVIIDWRSMTVARSNFDRFERHLGGQSNSVRSYRWKHLSEFVWNASLRPSSSVRGSVDVHPTQATSCVVHCRSSLVTHQRRYGRYGVQVRIRDRYLSYQKIQKEAKMMDLAPAGVHRVPSPLIFLTLSSNNRQSALRN